MVWVKDCNDHLININNFDRLYWISIEDRKTNGVALYKFVLDNVSDKKEHVLGYAWNISDLCEETMEKITKGIDCSLNCYESALYWYLDAEFEAIQDKSKTVTERVDDQEVYVALQIKKNRFFETE